MTWVGEWGKDLRGSLTDRMCSHMPDVNGQFYSETGTFSSKVFKRALFQEAGRDSKRAIFIAPSNL